MNWTAFFQTLLSAAVNVGLGILATHYGGPAVGFGTMAAGTVVAHTMQSPYVRQ